LQMWELYKPRTEVSDESPLQGQAAEPHEAEIITK